MSVDLENKIITYSFCESFKDRLVEYIRSHYIEQGRDLSRLAICFGGKRPALFIKRDLGKIIQKSFYPPRFFTIDELVQSIVREHESFRPAQDLDNCFLLYQLAKDVTPHILKGRESFAQFLPWVREILKFIDHLDLEYIDTRALKNVEANAQIGYDVPADINQLLVSIVDLREAYHKELMAAGTYSRGLQYFRAAKLVKECVFERYDQILFCNFFYFHRSEEVIVKDLYKRDKATLLFQGDQRKWPVLERISTMFSSPILEGEQPQIPAFSLNLHAGFDIQSQIGLVREVLKNLESLDNTVIVLPDPDHIIPLLSEISPLMKEFNISLGYPLKRSSLHTLFELIFKAQLSWKDGRYYTKDYLNVLRHPFVKNLKILSDMSITRILVHKIEEVLTGKEKSDISGVLFIDPAHVEDLQDLYSVVSETLARLGIHINREELRSLLHTIHDLLFTQWEAMNHFEEFSKNVEKFLNVFIDKSFLGNYPLNLNIATKISSIIEEFQNSSFSLERFEKEEMFRVFEQKMNHEFITFEGSPLKGVQILGLLETRSLNFDNVIIMDVNEGALPSLRIHEPLIPREVMISLGLDRLELEEEIQRYQFMRLISSAKNVHLIYQESKDKERSRFIEELIWEEQKQTGAMEAAPVTRASFQVDITPSIKTVPKTPEMIFFLRRHTFSASSINMYLRNPMDFYTNYVLGLRPQEDLLEEPDARHVGTFLHGVLEEGFKMFLGKRPVIDRTFCDYFMELFSTRFEESFSRAMSSDAFLLKSVIQERLIRFLNNEQSNEDRRVDKILYLEHHFDDVITLPVGDVKFRYVVDRIDRMDNGEVIILDYKTGNTDLMPRSVEQIESMVLSRGSIREHVKSFQVPLYFHYLNGQFPDDLINTALYNLKTLRIAKFVRQSADLDHQRIHKAFLRALNFIMEEILNPDINFEEDRGDR